MAASALIKGMETPPLEHSHAGQNLTIKEITSAVGPIKELKYNSQGDMLAVVGKSSNFAEIYNTRTKELVCALIGHVAPITCIAWHPDCAQKYIMTGSKDNSIKVWNSSNGTCIHSFKQPSQYKEHESPLTALAFSGGKKPLFLAGNSNGLPFISCFRSHEYKRAYVVDCLGFKENTGSIYHASLHKDGTLACIATKDGTVKLFARPNPFKEREKGEWGFKLEYTLEKSNVLESITTDQNHFFLRIKDISSGMKSCIVLKVVNDEVFELDLPTLDYCAQTDNFLTNWHNGELNNYELFELSFRGTENTPHKIFTSEAPIKSARYDENGTQILVTCDTIISILQKKNDTWFCMHSSSENPLIVLHPNNLNLFVSLSSHEGRNKDGIIVIHEAQDTTSITTINENSDEHPKSLKRLRESSLLDKTQIEAKQRKIASNEPESHGEEYSSTEEFDSSSDEESDSSSKEEFKFASEYEDDILLIEEELVIEEELETDTQANGTINAPIIASENEEQNSDQLLCDSIDTQALSRREKEIKAVVALYELVTLDPHILNKSLIEVIATHSDETIQKFITYRLRDSLNSQDNKGRTALFFATDENRESTVRLLAEQGADVNIANLEGMSPLERAISKRYLPIAQYLITRNALINNLTPLGETYLHKAVKERDLELIQILLNGNPDLDALDSDSNSVLSLVIKSKDTNILKIFGKKLKGN